MSNTQSYSRFNDQNYKNWLKVNESLYILRRGIQEFVETETETYHNLLRNKQRLSGQTCNQACDNKKSLCQLCQNWKKEIEANHNGRGGFIHWDNCVPHQWPKKKWEVAKAYMPRGHRQHREFAQFDVAAILNLMNFCNHFNNIGLICQQNGQCLRNVINVRNSVMHSPDLKFSNEDMTRHLKTVQDFAEILRPRVPKLEEDLTEEIKQFSNALDQNFHQTPPEVDGQQEDLQTMKDFQKVLDREQQALRDRIEKCISSFEGNQEKNGKDMKNLLDFLDQNKDLQEKLGPEVDQLKKMQTQLDQHEEQITNLTERVDHLEKVKHETEKTAEQSGIQVTNYTKFLKANSSWLIQDVKKIAIILDNLDLHDELIANVRVKPTDQDKMRELLCYMNCESIAKELFNALWEYEKRLMEERLGPRGS